MAILVLIVEDEPAILELISFTCKTSQMQVRRAVNVTEAKKNLEAKQPDIILLDWMLPDCSGLQWLKELKSNETTRKIPVIMLTARSQEDDRVAGLDAGADDYIVKPFSPRELIARIKAVARRVKEAEEKSQETLVLGPLEIDPDKFEAKVDGKVLKLSVVEFKLLQMFAKHPGRVYSRSQVIDRIWGYGAEIDERTVDVHMLRLRKQLSGTRLADFIETVRGLGYKATEVEHKI